MGLFDKLKESFAGDDKPKTFEVTFSEDRMGMSLSPGPDGEPVVTQGGQDDRTGIFLSRVAPHLFLLERRTMSKRSSYSYLLLPHGIYP